MNAVEQKTLQEIDAKLFGSDGMTGAIGFIRSEMAAGFDKLDGRIESLETTRAEQKAIINDRRTATERIRQERRWRVGLTLTISASVFMSALGLILAVSGVIK